MVLTKNILYMFPGVGSEYCGMGKELYDRYSIVREVYKRAKEVTGKNFYDDWIKTDQMESSYLYIQQSLVCLSYAIYQIMLEEFEEKPDYMMGYSLGEYSALACAGMFGFEEVLEIVRIRSEIIAETVKRNRGMMAWIVNLQLEVLEELVEEEQRRGKKIYISAYEAQEKNSVSGEKEAILSLADNVKGRGGMLIPIKVGGPFHCPLMREASEKFYEELMNFTFKKTNCNVLSNYAACCYENKTTDVVKKMAEQLSNPILWKQSLHAVENNSMHTIAVEIGPKTILKYIYELNSNNKLVYSVDKYADIEKLKKEREIGTKTYIEIIKKCLGIITATPNSCIDYKIYEDKVINEFEKIKEYVNSHLDTKIPRHELITIINKTINIIEVKGESQKMVFHIMSDLLKDVCLI